VRSPAGSCEQVRSGAESVGGPAGVTWEGPYPTLTRTPAVSHPHPHPRPRYIVWGAIPGGLMRAGAIRCGECWGACGRDLGGPTRHSHTTPRGIAPPHPRHARTTHTRALATLYGVQSPAGSCEQVRSGAESQAQWYHSASLSSESGESLRHVGCYPAECVSGTGDPACKWGVSFFAFCGMS
jgi:hypothetical protein